MALVYRPGDSIATAAGHKLLRGVVEFGGATIQGQVARIGNGTFVTERIDGVRGTADVRATFTSLSAGHGEYAGGAFLNGRDIEIVGVARAGSAVDALAACDALKAVINLTPATFANVAFQYRDWAQGRFAPCRLNGKFEVEEPAEEEEDVPWRRFRIPLKSTDATLRHATAQYGNTAAPSHAAGGAAVTAPNVGDFNARPVFRLFGAINGTAQIIDDAAVKALVLTDVVVPNGQYIDVNVAERTVRRSDGANLYAAFSGTWLEIPPGGRPLRMTVSAGANQLTGYSAIYRDTWG